MAPQKGPSITGFEDLDALQLPRSNTVEGKELRAMVLGKQSMLDQVDVTKMAASHTDYKYPRTVIGTYTTENDETHDVLLSDKWYFKKLFAKAYDSDGHTALMLESTTVAYSDSLLTPNRWLNKTTFKELQLNNGKWEGREA